MISSKTALIKLGNPELKENVKTMAVYEIHEKLRAKIPCLPKKIYCYKKLYPALIFVLTEIIEQGLEKELKTYDGCYNVRKIRGGSDFSLHSWGLAIDFNASENRLGFPPKMNLLVVHIFKKYGFFWGGNFKRWDGMHFELNEL